MAEVRWTEEAADRLSEIFEYIQETSPQAAAETVGGIYRLAETLDRFPERGFVYETRSGRSVRIVLYGHYRVVYRLEPGAAVIILGVFHGAMDLPRYLPQRWRDAAARPVDTFGRLEPGNPYRHREGVYRDEATDSDLFVLTLEKSEREYSPSTLYKDYAISPELVHWESQSTTSQASATGQRYIHHRENGANILLFVRQRRLAEWGTAAYTLLGAAEYVSHAGDRPIQFVWRLKRAMPADFFRGAKVATA